MPNKRGLIAEVRAALRYRRIEDWDEIRVHTDHLGCDNPHCLEHRAWEWIPQLLAALDALRTRQEEAEELVEKADAEEMHQTALAVLSRVFDDGPETALPEFLEWYKPSEWLHWSRALGAFIYNRLQAERARAEEDAGDLLAAKHKQVANAERIATLQLWAEAAQTSHAVNEDQLRAEVQRLTVALAQERERCALEADIYAKEAWDRSPKNRGSIRE